MCKSKPWREAFRSHLGFGGDLRPGLQWRRQVRGYKEDTKSQALRNSILKGQKEEDGLTKSTKEDEIILRKIRENGKLTGILGREQLKGQMGTKKRTLHFETYRFLAASRRAISRG